MGFIGLTRGFETLRFVFYAAHPNFFLLQNIAWNVRKKKKENFIAKFTEFLNILSFSAACDKTISTTEKTSYYYPDCIF